jgi:hypothetical protein
MRIMMSHETRNAQVGTLSIILIAGVAAVGACDSGKLGSALDGGTAGPVIIMGSGGATGSGTGVSAGGNIGTGSGGSVGGTSGVGSGGSTGTSAIGGSASAGCPVNPSACTDGIDNDGDGMTDALDSECSGPCDNDEGTFATGIPGDNMDDTASCKQDCFFDGNSGGEDDGCQFDLRCDPARTTSSACKYNTQPPGVSCDRNSDWAKCRNVCGRLTPNGCDCFGCCDLFGTGTYVRLSSSCTAEVIADPLKCERCTPVAECDNPCGVCEICIGRPAPSPDCILPPPTDGGTTVTTDAGTTVTTDAGSSEPCATGQIYCGRDPNACPAGQYCLTGCCTFLIP